MTTHPLTAQRAIACAMATFRYVVDHTVVRKTVVQELLDSMCKIETTIGEIVDQMGDDPVSSERSELSRMTIQAVMQTLSTMIEVALVEEIEAPSEDGPEAQGLTELGIICRSVGI